MVATAACVAVGSELLGGERLDSNSLIVTAELARFGVEVVEKRVVGDSTERLSRAIAELVERVEVVVLTGGLGPTADDITREAIADALGRRIVRSADAERWLRGRYTAFDRPVPPVVLKMADIVDGARPLVNERGAAPGLAIEAGGCLLVALPGVPWEMREMLDREVVPELERRFGGVRRASRTLLLGGVYESLVEQRIEPLYERFGRERITILATCGVVRLVLSATGGDDEVGARLDTMETAFADILGDDVAGVDVTGLEEAVLDRMRRVGSTLAVAESCTGGLLSARVTDVPGSSDVFLGGVVSYSNDAKQRLLGVPEPVISSHGAVSEPVARAMAEGVRSRFSSDWGVGITGIAGPGGGSDDKPVGLVHWAVASPGGTVARHLVFPGDRGAVRLWSVHAALDTLRRRLPEVPVR